MTNPLKLVIQAVVTHHVGVGVEPGSSGRAVSALITHKVKMFKVV